MNVLAWIIFLQGHSHICLHVKSLIIILALGFSHQASVFILYKQNTPKSHHFLRQRALQPKYQDLGFP